MVPSGSLILEAGQGLSWWPRVYLGCGRVLEDRGVLGRLCGYDQIPNKSHLRKEGLTLDQFRK